ncbi:hypothetical protein P879_07125 [Paragonimus westermani]|uniref:Uncharacterized protein n=1 Tax=Paragonimus westermani TaxID=34504 RepID=A0A8T0DL91_9TREM|nr:hypothetical protein P879_07125 [Paragonimus westermani]
MSFSSLQDLDIYVVMFAVCHLEWSNAFGDDNLHIHDGHGLVTNCLNTTKSRVKWVAKIPQSHTQFVFHDFPITVL